MSNKLDRSDLIRYLIPKLTFDDISEETVIKLTNELSEIEPFGDGIRAVDDDGDVIICPEYGISVSHNGKWLSSRIPGPSFDIDMGGNVRKSIEAQSFYICIFVSGILKDDRFSDELNDVTSKYNFDNMTSTVTGGKNFVGLLESWQGLKSYKINVIVSACKFTIADQKKTADTFLRDGIPEDLAGKL